MIILGTNSIKDTGYEVANSCRFNEADSPDLSRATGETTGATQWTFSAWIKRSTLGSLDNGGTFLGWYTSTSKRSIFGFNDDDKLYWWSDNGSGTQGDATTAAVFRDVSAWYHVVLKIDTPQASQSNRVKIYVNNVEQTLTFSGAHPAQSEANTGMYGKSIIGASYYNTGTDRHFGGYLAEVCLIDDSALSPSSFGEADEDSPNIWKPKDVSGLTFGSDGAYLDFEDSGNLGDDESGNGNDYTVTNLAATDQATDTCTNNFATFNSLFVYTTLKPSYSDGNLTAIFDNSGNNEHAPSTIAVANGKWYGEFKWVSATGTGGTVTGVFPLDADISSDINAQSHCYLGDGQKRVLNTSSSYGNSYTSGDIIGIALDMDNNKLYFSKNGTWQDSGDPTSGSTGTGAISITADKTYFMYCSDYASSGNRSVDANFGSPETSVSSGNADANGYGNMEYSVPSGYFSLCTKNLAEFG